MAPFNAAKRIFPIVGGRNLPGKDESFDVDEVFGTAFPVGRGFWLTAGHVLSAAAASGRIGLGFLDENRYWRIGPCARYECFDSHDIGIVEAHHVPDFEPTGWLVGQLPMSHQVFSTGFALNRVRSTVQMRSFSGNIVAVTALTVLPSHPRGYELQFQCPRGLSGAPVWINLGDAPAVAGVVIGNAQTQMLVLSDRETLSEGTTPIVECYETLQLGIAIQSDAIGTLRSTLLTRTIQEHLEMQSLLYRVPNLAP